MISCSHHGIAVIHINTLEEKIISVKQLQASVLSSDSNHGLAIASVAIDKEANRLIILACDAKKGAGNNCLFSYSLNNYKLSFLSQPTALMKPDYGNEDIRSIILNNDGSGACVIDDGSPIIYYIDFGNNSKIKLDIEAKSINNIEEFNQVLLFSADNKKVIYCDSEFVDKQLHTVKIFNINNGKQLANNVKVIKTIYHKIFPIDKYIIFKDPEKNCYSIFNCDTLESIHSIPFEGRVNLEESICVKEEQKLTFSTNNWTQPTKKGKVVIDFSSLISLRTILNSPSFTIREAAFIGLIIDNYKNETMKILPFNDDPTKPITELLRKITIGAKNHLAGLTNLLNEYVYPLIKK